MAFLAWEHFSEKGVYLWERAFQGETGISLKFPGAWRKEERREEFKKSGIGPEIWAARRQCFGCCCEPMTESETSTEL